MLYAYLISLSYRSLSASSIRADVRSSIPVCGLSCELLCVLLRMRVMCSEIAGNAILYYRLKNMNNNLCTFLIMLSRPTYGYFATLIYLYVHALLSCIKWSTQYNVGLNPACMSCLTSSSGPWYITGPNAKEPVSEGGLCSGQPLMMCSAACSGSPPCHAPLCQVPTSSSMIWSDRLQCLGGLASCIDAWEDLPLYACLWIPSMMMDIMENI